MNWLRCCIFAVVVLARTTEAQTVVAGRVIDRTRRVVLQKVSVELLGPVDTVLATGQTAGDGTFTLMAPAGGSYRVRLTAPGSEAYLRLARELIARLPRVAEAA